MIANNKNIIYYIIFSIIGLLLIVIFFIGKQNNISKEEKYEWDKFLKIIWKQIVFMSEVKFINLTII